MLIKPLQELMPAYHYMEQTYPSLAPLKIDAIKTDDYTCVTKENDIYTVYYSRKSEFVRGLSFVMNGKTCPKQTAKFESIGLMFNASHGSVPTVAGVKRYMTLCAMMGFNMFMLYTEDTYEIEGERYAGYLRGRITAKEMKEIDDFADMLGIELVPCIQTLAHLAKFMKWQETQKYRDCGDVLLVDNEQTYDLIERMIRSASSPVRSRRIHIGMDEAMTLGEGNYLKNHERTDKFEIFIKHLEKVCEITDKYGLKPIIWSDAYLREANPDRDYWSLAPMVKTASVPDGLQLAYWDYHHFKVSDYECIINKHLQITDEVMFCPTVWNHHRVSMQYPCSLSATLGGLKACLNTGVKHILNTIWGEGMLNEDYVLPNLVQFGEFAYNGYIDDRLMQERFRDCTGCELNAFYALGKADLLAPPLIKFRDSDNMMKYCNEEQGEGVSDNPIFSNSTYYFTFQDPMLGTMDCDAKHIETLSYLDDILEEIDSYDYGEFGILAEHEKDFIRVYKSKATLGVRMKEAYDKKDKQALFEIANNEIPVLTENLRKMKLSHFAMWERFLHPYAFEEIDAAYGRLLARLDTTARRLNRYVDGETNILEELEEERLPFYTNGSGPLSRSVDRISLMFVR